MKNKSEVVFVCKNCGNESSKWMGKCLSCGEWNSMVEAPKTNSKHEIRSSKLTAGEAVVPVSVTTVEPQRYKRIGTGMAELDNVLGGGIVPGQVALITGEPGIGKSTLLLEVAGGVNKILNSSTRKLKIVYVCGEESVSQVAMRAKRLGVVFPELVLSAQTDVDQIIDFLEKEKDNLGLVVVDSIQTMEVTTNDSVPGSVGQIKESAQRLVYEAKRLGVGMFIVGHVTKDGDLAGPRMLEHMVDTVLWFEGERSQRIRTLRSVKNRFGPTDEVGIFEMSENGLAEVSNPSELLLEERVKNVPGSVVAVVMEGTRPMLVEVQALVVPTQLAVPRRVASGVDFNRLQMLCAVLIGRANIDLAGTDVFVNVAGGIKVSDPSLDLAICLAIASSYKKKGLDPSIAAVGEVGLMGEVRKVGGLGRRIKEAKRLGYKVASAESGKLVGDAVKKLVI